MRSIIISTIILFIFAGQARSAHIVGGDVSYACMGLDTVVSANGDTLVFANLEITATVYRDLFGGGAEFDTDARFGVYRGNGNNWVGYNSPSPQNYDSNEEVEIDQNPCVQIPAGVGVEKAVYNFNIRVEINGDNYLVSYQRCCRNGSIGNLINPGDTGAAFQIEITHEALVLCNDSPTFNNFPPIFICVNSDINFDHSAFDVEGDDLVYSFCAPKTAGGTAGSGGPGSGDPESCDGVTPNPAVCLPPFSPVSFIPPFTATSPLGGNPIVEINSVTGQINGSPTLTGQYVVGVCVQEFKDGILMSETRRDFQFNVVTCTPLVFAELEAEVDANGLDFVLASCGENTVNINNNSYNEDFIQNYEWWFDINGDTTFFDTRDVSVTFPGIGDYPGRMILNKGTDCADTADIMINVYPDIDADFEFLYDTCVAGPVAFEDLSFTGADQLVNWEWDFSAENQSGLQNPSYIFEEPGVKPVSLIVTDDNECTDEIVKNVNYYPVPPLLIVQPSRFIACAPGEIFFSNLSSPINEEYSIDWNFGDGTSRNEISPIHTYEDPGVYTVDLTITSPIGCVTEKTYTNWISVEEKPTADFSFNPENPDIFNRQVSFTDLSTDSEAQQWNFNDDFITLEKNPNYFFPDSGMYEVRLIAFHETGCPDTIIKNIDIRPLVDYFMPNAFTPNGDGENDEFIGKGFVNGLKDFQIIIWNRWGEMIYQTQDPYNGWNGRHQNDGDAAPQGVYVWELRYEGPRGGVNSTKGHVTLLR